MQLREEPWRVNRKQRYHHLINPLCGNIWDSALSTTSKEKRPATRQATHPTRLPFSGAARRAGLSAKTQLSVAAALIGNGSYRTLQFIFIIASVFFLLHEARG